MSLEDRVKLAANNLRRANRQLIGDEAYAKVIKDYNDAVAALEASKK